MPENYTEGAAQATTPTQERERYRDEHFGLNQGIGLKAYPEPTPKQLIKKRADELRYEAAQLDELVACLPDRMMGYAESALILILKSAFNGGK